jgi:ribosomal protein S24E
MSIIETITDVSNAFLSRRELTCNFAGLGGKLKSLEAADMITKEFKLDGKVVIPMRLKTQVGKSLITGTFYIYEDEALAKKHINPTIFSRIEKTKAKLAEAETAAKEAETAAKEAEAPPAEAAKEAEAVEAPAEETKKEEKTE